LTQKKTLIVDSERRSFSKTQSIELLIMDQQEQQERRQDAFIVETMHQDFFSATFYSMRKDFKK